jgi:hypothetical protein
MVNMAVGIVLERDVRGAPLLVSAGYENITSKFKIFN